MLQSSKRNCSPVSNSQKQTHAAGLPMRRRTPQYPSQRSLSSTIGLDTASGIGVENARTVTPGSGEVVVAVIDSGILPHPDIRARVIAGADLINDTLSNDGDGRDSDNTDDGDSFEGRASSWHGLHVAGTFGASMSNGIGVAGIDRRARVQPTGALGTCGGYSSDVDDAIRWAAGLPMPGVPSNPTPANVVNLSLGGSGACSSIEQSAIDASVAAGAVVAVAVGKSASDLDAASFSPASRPPGV